MHSYFAAGFNEIMTNGRELTGNKAYNLALLSRSLDEVNIPESVVLFSNVNRNNINAKIEVLEYLKIHFAYPFIVRSSTTVEDSEDSFAGLFLSTICQNEANLFRAIDDVLNSSSSNEVVQYCKFKKIEHSSIRTAVLMQEYIRPDCSGVLFTKQPLLNDDSVIYIEYKEMTSDVVTSGLAIPHSMVIQKDKSISYNVLFDSLKDIALSAEKAFGSPIDMEWVYSNNKVWIVQIRPITT